MESNRTSFVTFKKTSCYFCSEWLSDDNIKVFFGVHSILSHFYRSIIFDKLFFRVIHKIT